MHWGVMRNITSAGRCYDDGDEGRMTTKEEEEEEEKERRNF